MSSEFDMNTNDATAGSTAECDVTVTEDTDSSTFLEDEVAASMVDEAPPLITKSGSIPNTIDQLSEPDPSRKGGLVANITVPLRTSSSGSIYKNVSPMKIGKQERDFSYSAPKLSRPHLGSDKWCSSKEKFLNIKRENKLREEKTEKLDTPKLIPGAIVVKESFIQPPKISRVSKSFHGKSSTCDSSLNVAVIPRRASEGVQVTSKTEDQKIDSGAKQRFTTTRVDESQYSENGDKK